MPEKHSASLAFIAWTVLQGNSTAKFVQHLNSEVCSNWPALGGMSNVTEALSGGCRRLDELVHRLLSLAVAAYTGSMLPQNEEHHATIKI